LGSSAREDTECRHAATTLSRGLVPVGKASTADRKRTVYLALLVILGLTSRLIFLSHPSQVVFDEVGFGKRVNAYGWSSERLFDVHPPHGTLLNTAIAKIGGYKGTIDFSKIGQPCAESIVPLRLLPALAGGLIPAFGFLVLRQLKASSGAAFLGGIVLTFDNAFIVQSRVVGLDALLVFFFLTSLSALLAARNRTGRKKFALMLLAGGLSGLAAGTKFTGLAAIALSLVVIGDDWIRDAPRRSQSIVCASLFLGAALAIYSLGWAIHFQLMTTAGPDDAFFIPRGHFWSDIIRLHQVMLSANAGITTSHPYSSLWWQWLVMKKPIFYWVKGDAGIYFIGNPVVWWTAGCLIIWVIGNLIFSRARATTAEDATKYVPLFWIPLTGFFISIVPLVPVTRPLFLYHYLPALTFAIFVGILWLDAAVFVRRRSSRVQRVAYQFILSCIVLMFALVAPITYGLGWLGSYHGVLRWFGLIH
jgi:dolichyl-phosphate-mannose--protein O-mannosyl transferase